MKYFETVVVVTDEDTFELGAALRASLECFRLHVDFHRCHQRRRLLEVLGGDVAPSQHIVLCAHGWSEPQPESLNFRQMVDLIDGRWGPATLQLTPDVVRETVRLSGRTALVLGGCQAGRPGLAEAFHDIGCSHYIAPSDEVSGVDADSALLFAIGFFYELMQEERDPRVACSVEEAVRRAAAIDALSQEGTHLYRCFTRT